jgi:hypothetical protein
MLRERNSRVERARIAIRNNEDGDVQSGVLTAADPLKLAACAGAALVYAGLAWLVYERGLRRHTSGSRIIELR